MVVETANKNDIGFNKLNEIVIGNRKNIIAPRPAPAEIPSNPDSARLFRNRDCKIIPEQDNDAPTKTEFIIRGSLISKMIFLLISLLEENIVRNSEKDIEVLPINNETNIDRINIKRRTNNIVIFLDNYDFVLIFKIEQSNYICNE
jgi:hypothetical protein